MHQVFYVLFIVAAIYAGIYGVTKLREGDKVGYFCIAATAVMLMISVIAQLN